MMLPVVTAVLSAIAVYLIHLALRRRKSQVGIPRAISAAQRIADLSFRPDDFGLLSLQRFQTVTNNTECIFARTAKLWGSCPWIESMTLQENVLRNAEALVTAMQHARQGVDELHRLLLPRKTSPWADLAIFGEKMKHVRKLAAGPRQSPTFLQQILGPNDEIMSRATEIFLDRVDGFVLEIPGEIFSSDIRELSHTVHTVLETLSRHNTNASEWGLFKTGCPSPQWFFSFDGEPITVTTFAPFYPITNSRHQFCNKLNRDCCYVLFQPESAFHFQDTGPGRVKSQMNWQRPISNREKIRCLYRKHEREYDIADVDDGALPQSVTTLRPLYLGQRPIKWWLPDPFASSE